MENEKDLEKEELTSECDDRAEETASPAAEEPVAEEPVAEEPAAEERTCEEGGVTPNDVLFGAEEEVSAPKKGFFSSAAFKVLAAVLAIAVVVGGLAVAGVFNNFIEGYIKKPDEQLKAVMERELERSEAEYLEYVDSLEYPEEISYNLDASVRLSDTLLEYLNEMELADFDFTTLKALNDLVLRLAVGMGEEQLILRVEALDGDDGAGIASVIDTAEDAIFVSVDFLTDALVKIDAYTDIPEYKLTPDKMSEDEVKALFGVYESIVGIVLENAGEPLRERDTVDVDGKKVKCDLLKLSIDRDGMTNIISGISEMLEDEDIKDILLAGDEMRSAQYDELIGELADIDAESLPEDMNAEVSLFIKDGELVGISIEEEVSETSLYYMELTGVIEISTKVTGVSVKFGGQIDGDEGVFTLRVGDIKLGKMTVSGITTDKLTATVTLSDEISSMAELYLGADSPFGDLGEYAFIIELQGDEFDYSFELSAMRGEEELAYLCLGLTSGVQIEPIDIEGRECYGPDQIEEWKNSVDYTKIFDLPSSLLKFIMQFAAS